MIGTDDARTGMDADTGDHRTEWAFPAAPEAVRVARAAVRGQLALWGLDGQCGDIAALLVSELVTNSLCYAAGPIGVRLVRTPARDGTGGSVVVEVSDPLPDMPCERVPTDDDEHGRGLRLLAGAARRWGTRPGPEGKTVWFELPLPG